MATDITNYRRQSPWQMDVNDKVKYYDKDGNELGHLVEKHVLKERTYSPYYEGFYPGAYTLEFSEGRHFENVYDDSNDSKTSNFYSNYDDGDKIVFKPVEGRFQKGGRNRKQSQRRKTSKKRKHRRKSIRRR